MAYIAYSTTAHQTTYHLVTRVFPADTDGATALLAWVAANAGNTAAVTSPNTPRDVLGAAEGWYFNTAANTVVAIPPALTLSAAQKGNQRKNILRPWGLDLWRSLPTVDLSKDGEGTPRARKATLYVVKLCLLASNVSQLGDDAKWAEIEPLFDLDMGKFQRAMLVQVNSEDPTIETGGWRNDIELTDRNIYKPAASVIGATPNSVGPTQITSLDNSVPANWASDANFGANIDSIINYLYE